MRASRVLVPEQSGVYQSPADIGRLRRLAESSRAEWMSVDVAHANDKQSLLEAIAAAGAFPKTFGCNWDALADMLQDFSWRDAPAYVLHFTGAQDASLVLGDQWATLVEILRETATYWRERGKAFVVQVDGGSSLPVWL